MNGQKAVIFAVLVLPSFALAQTRQPSGDADFRRGETLLKYSRTTPLFLQEAYDDFSRAVEKEPGNKKFQKRKAAVGMVLSDKSLAEARGLLENQPVNAVSLIQRSLALNPKNQHAKQIMEGLNRRIAAAEAGLSDAKTAAYRGDTKRAAELMETIRPFRDSLLGFGRVETDLNSIAAGQRAQQLFADGRVSSAVDLLASIGPAGSDGSFASTMISNARRRITDSLVAQAEASPKESVGGLVQRGKLLRMAARADQSSECLPPLISETDDLLRSVLARSAAGLRFARETSAGRIQLGLQYVAAELVGVGPAISSAAVATGSRAYPELTFNVAVEDTQPCLPSAVRQQLESGISSSLTQVARFAGADADLTVRFADISCPRVDVPRQEVQNVNSTYVAGHTQMANPQYVEIQSALTSAEANLNRAHAAYQANQNFGTGLALGRARGEVNRLNRALASTPPYTASEILQAYQYQKFEAVRSAALKAVARVQSNRSRFGYSVKLEVPNSRELRREGVSGVLPGDKSGATNAEPGLPSMDELSSAVLGDFLKKAASEVRSAIAGYYAARASSEAEAAGDRIAAMLYLTDLGLNRYAVFA